MLKSLFILGVIIGLSYVFADFLHQNHDLLKIRLLWWESEGREIGSWMALSFLLGFLVTAVFLVWTALGKMMEASRLRRENSSLQKLLETTKSSMSASAGHSSSSNMNTPPMISALPADAPKTVR